MVNRSDAYVVFGGDTLQMEKTGAALSKLGVTVHTLLAKDLDKCDWQYDLVHLFNIQTVYESLVVANEVKRRGLPLVLSPIYWDPIPGWFNGLTSGIGAWGVAKQLLGQRIYGIYAAWQRLNYPRHRAWRAQRELLILADQILPNSHLEARQLLDDFRLPHSFFQRMKIVVNGIDGELFRELPKPSEKWHGTLNAEEFVLEVGRISPEKNNLALIEALKDVDIPIVFVGEPSPYSRTYAEQCHYEGKKRGQVHFLGFVPHSELPGIYALAKVHALPSWRETPGLASLEAAASGCNIVSTSIGSTKEYFGDLAEYCDPRDISSIKRAVCRALSKTPNPALREMVLQKYTWQKAAESTLNAYQMVMQKRCPIPLPSSS